MLHHIEATVGYDQLGNAHITLALIQAREQADSGCVDNTP